MGTLFKRNKKLCIGGGIMLIYILLTLLAPILAPYGYDAMKAGGLLEGPVKGHMFGTDNFGRDILSRVLYGGRASLGLSVLAMLVSVVLGTALGSISGFIGGKFDLLVMRIADALTSIPWILMAIIMTAIIGAGEATVVWAMGITHTPEIMRIMRGEAYSLREREFITAAYATGERKVSVLGRYIIPNSAATIIVQATLIFSKCIIMESAISYLGYGVQPPFPSWGALLSDSQKYMWQAPYYAIIPGLVIVMIVLATNLFGDGLRDELDPKFSGKR